MPRGPRKPKLKIKKIVEEKGDIEVVRENVVRPSEVTTLLSY